MARLPQPDPNANDLDACRRKRRYSYRGAHSTARQVAAEREPVKAYKCPHCLFWHLTKMGAGR
jgi:hypothetical protein